MPPRQVPPSVWARHSAVVKRCPSGRNMHVGIVSDDTEFGPRVRTRPTPAPLRLAKRAASRQPSPPVATHGCGSRLWHRASAGCLFLPSNFGSPHVIPIRIVARGKDRQQLCCHPMSRRMPRGASDLPQTCACAAIDPVPCNRGTLRPASVSRDFF